MARLRWAVLVAAHVAACGRLQFESRDSGETVNLARCAASEVTVGAGHTCAIDPDGGVWCWGINVLGQSAPDRGERNVLVAAAIALPAAAVEIGAGRDVSCARLVDGAVWCWGDNSSGELGQGTTTQIRGPVRVQLAEAATSLAVGAATVCATRASDRAVQCWGENLHDELGIPRTTPQSSVPVVLAGTAGTARVVFGHRHACAIFESGGVQCWGRGSSGQLGDGQMNSGPTLHTVIGLSQPVIAAAAAGRDTCTLEQGGTVRCFGRNETDQLATGTTVDVAVPGPAIVVDAVDVQLSRAGACARTASGQARCWGEFRGELGAISTPQVLDVPNVTALAMHYEHACAVSDGVLECWGDNDDGELGRGIRSIVTAPVAVDLQGVTMIDAGTSRVCAATSTGSYCWGEPSVGDGSSRWAVTPTLATTSLPTVEGITAGLTHTCAWGGGSSSCWGRNDFGQIGTGTATVFERSPRASSVTGVQRMIVGGFATYAITATTFVAWGRNSQGQLGNNSTVDSLTPVNVGVTSPTRVAAGSGHACAISSNTLRCWGGNEHGQVGDGTLINRPSPTMVAVGGPVDVGAGGFHTCALDGGGAVYCWGRNLQGQIGVGDRVDHLQPVPVALPAVAKLFVGDLNTCVITTAGQAYCWGQNSDGQLGNGTEGDDALVPVRVPALDNADEITPGYCARAGTTISCWGRRRTVGDGDTSTRIATPASAYCNR